MSKALTLKELKEFIRTYVDGSKIGVYDYDVTDHNIAHLMDKVGKVFTLDTRFYDPLTIFDGEELPLGKDVEEWYQDLIPPRDFNPTGDKTLAPAFPSYRKPTYSKSLGRKTIPTSIPYDNYERACNDENDFIELTSMQTKRIEDSKAVYKYGIKKQGIGVLCDKLEESARPTKTYAISTAYTEGEFVKKDSGFTAVGVIMKDVAVSNKLNWDDAVANGTIVITKLVNELAIPVDTKTGEAFVKQIKKDVKRASRPDSGKSLSGGVIGAEDGLVLLVKMGITDVIDVDVLAGAFNQDKVAIPAQIIEVEDFGTNNDFYAVLMDSRGMKLHTDYETTRENLNGEGDFLNLFRHLEYTLHTSRNTYVTGYRIPRV